MSDKQLPKSRDGWHWTKQAGLHQGVPSHGVIQPSTNISTPNREFDIMVIGAGYTGLTAVRELTLTGHKVLLLEARDRIGGRSWSSDIEGYPYEMGGTWVHWNQPSLYREIGRYGLHKELEVSPLMGVGIDEFHLTTPAGRSVMSHDEEMELRASGWKKFVNVDGVFCRKLIPFPHDPHFNREEVAKYDRMSFADRLAQIKDDLSPNEYINLEGFLAITSGGTMENSSFFEALRWWALGNYDMQQFEDLCLTFKFKHGQSAFARKFFDEARDSGRLSYVFNAPIAKITDQGTRVEVLTRDGQSFKGKRAICTVPLNVLHSIHFSPAFHPLKTEASKLGHVNHVSKVHFETKDRDLRTFSGQVFPNNDLTFMFGDGTTPAGNTHMVAFGSSYQGYHLQPEEDINRTIAAVQAFLPDALEIERVVFHNWYKDEFAQGAWEWLRPGMATKYLDVLRERHGNVFFASADWAMGWRGFIDGAIEDGTKVALDVKNDLVSRTAIVANL